MTKTAAIFWPGDYRAYPNEAALPMVEQATVQMEAALKRLGWGSYRRFRELYGVLGNRTDGAT